MKAIYIEEHGGPEVLKFTEDFERPQPKEDEVLVNIKATSINRVDTVIRRGYPGMQLPMPHIPGGDIAGEIVELGDNVTGYFVGDRIIAYPIVLPDNLNIDYDGREHLNDGWKYFGMHTKGSYAEFISVPAQNVYKLHPNISYEEAAALPISGLTAYYGMSEIANIRPGQTFFLWGGSGGMGTLVVQIAMAMGATVIATAGTDEKVQKLKEIGVDHAFRHDEDVVSEVLNLYPAGIDVILDYVGPATFAKTHKMIRKGGKILMCGMLTGMEVNLHIQQTYFRQVSILGYYLGTPDKFAEMIEFFGEKDIHPVIHKTIELKDAAEGHRIMEAREAFGKIVIRV